MALFFTGSTQRDALSYCCGEKIVFELNLTNGKVAPVACHHFQWHIEQDDGVILDGSCSGETGVCRVTAVLSVPGFVHLTVGAYDQQGDPMPDCRFFNGGAGAEIEKLSAGRPEPEDFDAFWMNSLELLDGVAPETLQMVEIDGCDPNCHVYDVKIYAGDPEKLGGNPKNRFGRAASGYVSVPKGVDEGKTYPIRMHFMGYSYVGASPATDPDCIVCLFNPHGLDNGLSQETYDRERDNTVGTFGFDNLQNAAPEDVYFKGMILRNVQSLRWAKTIHGWNGRDISAHGGSMGAFQACSLAALCPEVTELWIDVPWMCDLCGIFQGRLRGWRPDVEESGKPIPGIRYYDTAYFAARITCPVFIGAGLGDYICPPSGVAVLYNRIKTQKQIEWVQNHTHVYTAPEAVKYVRKDSF